MASSLLGSIGSRFKMSYTHNCHQTHPSTADTRDGPDLKYIFDIMTIQHIFLESGLEMEGDD
eukprot:15350545-Ditylum_brightwellii.AAC.1